MKSKPSNTAGLMSLTGEDWRRAVLLVAMGLEARRPINRELVFGKVGWD